MRHRLDRMDRTTDKLQKESKRMMKGDWQNAQQISPTSSSSGYPHQHGSHESMLDGLGLELEFENEDEAGENEALVAKSISSPIRERTRAAHHNGTARPTSPPSIFSSTSPIMAKTTPSKFLQWSLCVLVGTSLLIYLVPQQSIPPNRSKSNILKQSTPFRPRGRTSPPKVQYSCPVRGSIETPPNRDDATHGVWYDEVSQQILQGNNLTSYLAVYRQTEFDNWGLTYEQVKEAMREWKTSMYAPVFDNPDRVYSIYESACGIGLNLALTAELLYESVPTVKRVEIHGNDYVQESVTVAEQLYQQGRIVEQYKGRMGQFCAADSTRLNHVPSNAFDLVFTGYITPLTDPLSLAQQYDTPRDVERAYHAICENKTNPELVQQMQDAQEEFYRAWAKSLLKFTILI